MQLSLLADRASDFVLELTDSRLDESRRVAAGDELLKEIQSGHAKLDDFATITDSIALGMKTLPKQKRLPPNPVDFVFTDEPLTRLATTFMLIGKQIEQSSDHSSTKQERDDVLAFRQMHGLDNFLINLIDDIKNHDLTDMTEFVDQLSENVRNMHEADDNLVAGQNILLDIPLAILAQFYLAAGHRLEQLTKYSLPIS